MKWNSLKLLQVLLLIGALYYLVAAFAHFFGLTIFPAYDAALYSPYHDTLLALCDLIFVMLFVIVAKDPVKNSDTLTIMIIGFILVIIFNFGLIWKIDFTALGSVHKKFQTIIETLLAAIMLILLLILRPKEKKK